MELTRRERDWGSGDCREQGPSTKLWRWRSQRVAH
jgi:hypothetical protein